MLRGESVAAIQHGLLSCLQKEGRGEMQFLHFPVFLGQRGKNARMCHVQLTIHELLATYLYSESLIPPN